MNSEKLENRLLEFIDGQLDQDECSQLVELLKSDPKAFDLYCEYAELDATMTGLINGSLASPASQSGMINKARKRNSKRAQAFALLAACLMLFATGLVLRALMVKDPITVFKTSPGTLFEVIHAEGNQNSDKVQTLDVGSRVNLYKGSIDINLASGVQMLVEAPAELVILKDDHLQLDRGKLWARVPEEAVGFKVKTPHFLLTDLGTEFGIISSPETSEKVYVLEGAVALRNHLGSAARIELSAGEARSANVNGGWDEIPYEADLFLTALPEEELPYPYLHWSFDDDDNPFLVQGSLPGAGQITTQAPLPNARPAADRLVPGKQGKALSFNGQAERLITDWKGLTGRTPRTLACWIKLKPNSKQGWGVIAEWGDLSTKGAFWRARITPAQKEAAIRLSYSGYWAEADTDLADSQWHHVSFVDDGELDEWGFPNVTLFVDGKEKRITNSRKSTANNSFESLAHQPLIIGGSPTKRGTNTSLHGEIDELFIFEGALSQDAIRRLISSHHP